MRPPSPWRPLPARRSRARSSWPEKAISLDSSGSARIPAEASPSAEGLRFYHGRVDSGDASGIFYLPESSALAEWTLPGLDASAPASVVVKETEGETWENARAFVAPLEKTKDGRRVRFAMPPGTWDLAIVVPGFAPAFVMELDVLRQRRHGPDRRREAGARGARDRPGSRRALRKAARPLDSLDIPGRRPRGRRRSEILRRPSDRGERRRARLLEPARRQLGAPRRGDPRRRRRQPRPQPLRREGHETARAGESRRPLPLGHGSAARRRGVSRRGPGSGVLVPGGSASDQRRRRARDARGEGVRAECLDRPHVRRPRDRAGHDPVRRQPGHLRPEDRDHRGRRNRGSRILVRSGSPVRLRTARRGRRARRDGDGRRVRDRKTRPSRASRTTSGATISSSGPRERRSGSSRLLPKTGSPSRRISRSRREPRRSITTSSCPRARSAAPCATRRPVEVLAGAEVAFAGSLEAKGSEWGRFSTSTTSDGEGRFRVGNLLDKPLEVDVTLDGYAPSVMKEVRPTPDGTEIEVQLEKGNRLTGVVVDELGAPLSNVAVGLDVDSRRRLRPAHGNDVGLGRVRLRRRRDRAPPALGLPLRERVRARAGRRDLIRIRAASPRPPAPAGGGADRAPGRGRGRRARRGSGLSVDRRRPDRADGGLGERGAGLRSGFPNRRSGQASPAWLPPRRHRRGESRSRSARDVPERRDAPPVDAPPARGGREPRDESPRRLRADRRRLSPASCLLPPASCYCGFS